jgi:diguanylate cyclase (GGDEF)-like protein
MKNNKTIILVILLAALSFASVVDVMTQPLGNSALQGLIIVLAAASGWYAAQCQAPRPESSSQSITDNLTGLHTYNYFIDRLNEEKKRADRFGSRTSMILVEIDGFQGLGSAQGAAAANDLVKEVGEIVKVQVRGVDIISRYNTAQFGILLPNTGRVASHEVAERMRAAIEKAGSKNSAKTTVSLGLASYPDDAEDDLQLIERTEATLEQAKATGNQVKVFGGDEKSTAS